MDKAIEAAAKMTLKEKLEDGITAAFSQYASYEDARQAGIINIATDACLAVIAALKEDPEVVERIAGVVAEGFYFGMPQVDPDAVPDGLARDIARAALSALKGEVKP